MGQWAYLVVSVANGDSSCKDSGIKRKRNKGRDKENEKIK